MHSSISINTLCFAPAGLQEHVDAIARLEARGVSPEIEQVMKLGTAKTAQLLRDSELQVATMTHRAFGYATKADTDSARERLKRTIDAGAEIGAQSIIMTTGGRGDLTWVEACARFAEAIAPCAEQAKQAGLVLGIEQTSHLFADASIAHRLSDGIKLCRDAGVSVIIDIFACWFDSNIEDAIAEAGPITQLVQISDYVYGDRSLPCRAVPGDGAIPFQRLIPLMVKAGIRGFYDLEIIGPRLISEGTQAGLLRAGKYIGSLLEDAGLKNA